MSFVFLGIIIKVFKMKDNLKYKERDVLTATDNSVLVLEPNTSFVNVLKRITGLAILLCTFLFHTENIIALRFKLGYWKTKLNLIELRNLCRDGVSQEI